MILNASSDFKATQVLQVQKVLSVQIATTGVASVNTMIYRNLYKPQAAE